MARYAQFTAESFAARTKPAPAPMPAQPPMPAASQMPAQGEYGSLLVVRVGRPKKRPVLMLDPAEAAEDAIRFQQIAAHDFAHPDEAIGRGAVLRLSALAANESGLEAEDDRPEAETDADEALALWTNPAEPVDPSGWNDGAEADLPLAADEPQAVEPAFAEPERFPAEAMVPSDRNDGVDADLPPLAAEEPQAVEPAFAEPESASGHAPAGFEPFFIDREDEPGCAAPAFLPDAEAEPWLDAAEPETRPGLWRRIAHRIREFLALF